MKYLVTGASGFLGTHLCNYFKKNGIDYIGATRENVGDLTLFSDWPRLFENIDVVVHAAAKAHDMSGAAGLKETYHRVNLKLTQELASAAKKNGVKKFIFISTIKVNGEFSGERPFKADDKPNPTDDYGVSKHLAEQEVLKLHAPGIFDVVIIRPCLIYGPGVKANFKNLINLVKTGLPLPFGAIHNKRSFVSVDNLSSFILHCSTNPQASGHIFLVSDGQDLSLTELLKAISSSLNVSPLLLPVPAPLLKFLLFVLRKTDLSVRLFSNLQVDIRKNKEILGWNPPYNTDDELKKIQEPQP